MGKRFDIEQVKLIHDHTKHLTTLSAGSIVALVTLYEKLAASHNWKFLIAIALISFVASIIGGVYAQIGMIDYADPEHDDNDPATGVALIVSWRGFALAMLSISIYGIKNI